MEHALVDRIGRRQRGLVTLAQWKEAGGSERSWYRAIGTGRLAGVHPRVARLPGAEDSPSARIQAALLSIDGPPEAGQGLSVIGSHTSAALLLGADAARTPVHLTLVRSGHRPSLDGVVIHRPRDAGRLVSVRAAGLPVTTPARTILDCASILDEVQLGFVLEDLLIRKHVSFGGLQRLATAERRQGHHGAAALRALLEDVNQWAKPPDSVLEVAFAELLRSHGLPAAVFHRKVVLGPRSFELDFAYEGAALPIDVEVDGWASHGSSREFEANRERDALLQAAGWVVQRFTWFQVVRRPAFVARVLRDLLGRHGYLGAAA